MTNDHRVPCPTEDLQVSGISQDEWRVADGRLSDSSPSKVLGFIQRKSGRFEVLTLASPDVDLRFDDWVTAVASFGSETLSKGNF